MSSNAFLNSIGYLLRLVNLVWYILLSPLFARYLLMHASGLKQWLLIGHQHLLRSISKVSVAKDPAGATNSAIANKQGLDRAAGSGVFPLTVCLGLFYTPFYLFTLTQWSVQDFLQWNIPMMFLFGLVCSEDTHYDSHYWLTRRHQNVWYRRLISARFKQYTQMIWYPLTQHMPHLHIHHKFNMKNEQDIDYVGCFERDGFQGFFAFLSTYDWNYNWASFRYFAKMSPSKVLLRTYVKDMALNYGLLIFAAYFGYQKFLFQYTCHSLCYYYIAWITFYVEHPFHHRVNDSYEHHWNVLTLVDSKSGVCNESHTSHHIWPARSIEENASWANSALKFAQSQLENQHLALNCDGTFEELLHLPYLIITKQYSKIAAKLHFKEADRLKEEGMDPVLIQAYQDFRARCDGSEIKRRLQAH